MNNCLIQGKLEKVCGVGGGAVIGHMECKQNHVSKDRLPFFVCVFIAIWVSQFCSLLPLSFL